MDVCQGAGGKFFADCRDRDRRGCPKSPCSRLASSPATSRGLHHINTCEPRIRFIGKSQLQCRQRFKDDLSAHDKRRFPALVKRHITGLLRLLAGHPCFQDAANKTLTAPRAASRGGGGLALIVTLPTAVTTSGSGGWWLSGHPWLTKLTDQLMHFRLREFYSGGLKFATWRLDLDRRPRENGRREFGGHMT